MVMAVSSTLVAGTSPRKDLKDHRYQGYLQGAGLATASVVAGKHWNLEASIGAGFARINYIQIFPA